MVFETNNFTDPLKQEGRYIYTRTSTHTQNHSIFSLLVFSSTHHISHLTLFTLATLHCINYIYVKKYHMMHHGFYMVAEIYIHMKLFLLFLIIMNWAISL